MFDKNKPQTITLTIEETEVSFTFSPIPDDRFLQFLDATATKMDADGTEMSFARLKPSVKLFDEFCIGVTESGEEVKDHLEVVDVETKRDAVALWLEVQVAPKEDGRKLFAREQNKVIETECFDNSEIIAQTHTCKPKTVELSQKFESLASIPLGGRGARLGEKADVVIPHHGREKVKLYDQICEEQTGYTDGVPAWHKIAVVNAYFGSGAKRKN